MLYSVTFYSPDTHLTYDLHTLNEKGVGGGATARIRLAHALADLGHPVTIYNNCPQEGAINNVSYLPFGGARKIETDLLIASTSGAGLDLSQLGDLKVDSKLQILMVHGLDPPAGISLDEFDYLYAPSNFVRDRIVAGWGIPPEKVFTAHRGVVEKHFRIPEEERPQRDPFGLVYISHPSKGLTPAIEILKILRGVQPEFSLHVYGGAGLWGGAEKEMAPEANVVYEGLIGQKELASELHRYSFALNIQDIEDTFGISLIEAMRAGCIVLGSPVGAFPETIRTGLNGFIVPGRSDAETTHRAAADLILDLAENQADKERIQRRAAASPLSWDAVARTWQGHWDWILKDKSSRVSIRAASACPECRSESIRLADGLHCLACGRYFKKRKSVGKKKYHQVTIVGYYGYGNLGDEAILSAIIRDLRLEIPGLEILVISGDPEETQNQHRVEAVGIGDLPGIAEFISTSDLLILGGGGLFHDYWEAERGAALSENHSGLTLYQDAAILANLSGTPLMISAVGVGPLTGEIGRTLTRRIFALSSGSTVRDGGSLRALEDCCGDLPDISITADPAFRLPVSGSPQRDGLPEDPRRPLLGAALRNWNIDVEQDRWEKQVAKAIDGFIEDTGGSAVFLPFQRNEEDLLDDAAIAVRIFKQMRHPEGAFCLEGKSDPDKMIQVISSCDLLLGMRYHSIVFSLLAGTPAVGLAYDRKVSQLMEDAGLSEYLLDLADLNAKELTACLVKTLESTDQLQELYSEAVKRSISAGEGNLQVVKRLLAEPPRDPAAARAFRQIELEAFLAVLADKQRSDSEREESLLQRIECLDREKDSLGQSAAKLEEELAERGQQISQIEQDLAVRSQQIAQLGEDLERQALEIESLTESIRQAEQQISQQQKDHREALERKEDLAEQLESQVAEKDALARHLHGQLDEIKGSRGWKLLWWLWEIRSRVAPKGSWLDSWLLGRENKASPHRRSLGAWARLLKNTRRLGGMSAPEYAFDTYKRTRLAMVPDNLEKVRLGSEQGLVSIVLPVYNGEAYLAEALESILAQTYQNFELLIIDDGSEDHTGEIAQRYAENDSRVKYFFQRNQRLPAALSLGFDQAQGEYLTWTSHDNRFRPEFLEVLVSEMAADPSLDMLYANIDLIDENGEPLTNSVYYSGYQWPPGSQHIRLPVHTGELNTRANNSIGGAFLYRDRVHWLIGDYSSLRFTREDYDYWMRINALLRVKHANHADPLYEYRFHSGSLTARDQELGITKGRNHLMVFDDFRRDFNLCPLIWVIAGEKAAADTNAAEDWIRQKIAGAGHMLISEDELSSYTLPEDWVPGIYLNISAEYDGLPLPCGDLPGSWLACSLVVSPGEEPPSGIAGGWDVYAAVGSDIQPVKLDNKRQGWLAADDLDTIFSALDIRARSKQFSRIEGHIEAGDNSQLPLTVIVCTYQRGEKIIPTLQSLVGQSLPRSDYEIIVVNNDPRDQRIEQIVGSIRDAELPVHPGWLRVVDCPPLGLSHARNAGISEALGELVLFIDDDAIASQDTLESYRELFSAYPDAGVIGGQILSELPDDPLPVWREDWKRYWSHREVSGEHFQPVEDWWDFPWGANWCARRQALLKIGGFRGSYGRKGRNFAGGEEIVAASLIQELGYTIGVTPATRVAHVIDESRFTYQHLRCTIHAGQQSIYRARQELRIPIEDRNPGRGSAGRRLRGLIAAVKDAGSAERTALLLEQAYHCSSRMRLRYQRLLDFAGRFRRPTAAK